VRLVAERASDMSTILLKAISSASPRDGARLDLRRSRISLDRFTRSVFPPMHCRVGGGGGGGGGGGPNSTFLEKLALRIPPPSAGSRMRSCSGGVRSACDMLRGTRTCIWKGEARLCGLLLQRAPPVDFLILALVRSTLRSASCCSFCSAARWFFAALSGWRPPPQKKEKGKPPPLSVARLRGCWDCFSRPSVLGNGASTLLRHDSDIGRESLEEHHLAVW